MGSSSLRPLRGLRGGAAAAPSAPSSGMPSGREVLEVPWMPVRRERGREVQRDEGSGWGEGGVSGRIEQVSSRGNVGSRVGSSSPWSRFPALSYPFEWLMCIARDLARAPLWPPHCSPPGAPYILGAPNMLLVPCREAPNTLPWRSMPPDWMVSRRERASVPELQREREWETRE